MRGVLARLAGWSLTVAAIVLTARTLCYALVPVPDPLAAQLAAKTGGPGLVAVALGSVGLGAAVAIGCVAVAALALKERMALEPLVLVRRPSLHPSGLALRALSLWLSSCACFALFESYLHMRSGLGWHGLSCLTGPVHRDAVPFLAALSLLATALAAVAAHILAWMRRTLVRLAGRPRLPRLGSVLVASGGRDAPAVPILSPTQPRAPPGDRGLPHPVPPLQRKERVCSTTFSGLPSSWPSRSASWQPSCSRAAPMPMLS
jgi:hypothetical protein